jgi:CRISPR/Cas system endoribonuclease Cas6 (RAMP superfamily)
LFRWACHSWEPFAQARNKTAHRRFPSTIALFSKFLKHLVSVGIVLADYRLSGRQMLLDGQSHHSLEAVRIMLTALSRFAFFAGAGIETARGMGATRVTIAEGKKELGSGL